MNDASAPSTTAPSDATVNVGFTAGGVESATVTDTELCVACAAAPPSIFDADNVPNATPTDPFAVSESTVDPPENVNTTDDTADADPANVTVGVPLLRPEHDTPDGSGDGHDTV